MDEILHVACVQMSSTDSVVRNLSVASDYVRQAANLGSHLVVLPENFVWMGKKDAVFDAESVKHIRQALAAFAKQYDVWIVAGSMLCTDVVGEKPLNRSLVFNPQGEVCQHYDKIHLFEAVLNDESWKESERVQAGETPAVVQLSDAWRMGLSICYDLRFASLYEDYARQGCNILTVPSAFTVETGKAHWEVLLKARAIENQCYVLAAAQVGEHADGRHTYGHSMIVDPWGEVLAVQEEAEGVIHAELSLAHLQRIRQKIPQNRMQNHA